MQRKAIVLARAADAPMAHRPETGPATARVANRPIIWHVLESLEAAGVTETAVVGPATAVADLRETIEHEGGRESAITYLPSAEGAGLIETLAPAASFVGEASCIVHSADGLAGDPLAPFADMLRPGHPDLVLLLHGDARRRQAVDEQALHVLRISEITGFSSPTALAGACLLGEGAIQLACARGADSPADLPRLAERVTSAGGHVQAGRVSWRSYTGDPQELLDMNRMVLDQLPGQPYMVEPGDNQIEGRVIIHPSAEVRSSVISGPVIIGARAVVDSAYIGPYTSIGADVHIEGSEISRSIILEGARILHVRDRIEASTVGRNATMRTDFSLPRALRMNLGDGAQLHLS